MTCWPTGSRRRWRPCERPRVLATRPPSPRTTELSMPRWGRPWAIRACRGKSTGCATPSRSGGSPRWSGPARWPMSPRSTPRSWRLSPRVTPPPLRLRCVSTSSTRPRCCWTRPARPSDPARGRLTCGRPTGSSMLPMSIVTSDVVAALRDHGVQDVDDSALARALYSTDASLYRVEPTVVVRPRDVDEVLAVVDACARTGVPLTSRGAGTSIAGNAVGTGVVMDFTKYLNRVHDVDVDARTARVDPGVVHASLQRAVAPHGLRYGPDPSTHTRCTVGGMIGNNACGNRALGYGRSADNVAALHLVTAGGEQLRVGRDLTTSSPTLERLRGVVGEGLGTIRTEFGRFGRQVSGYSLEHLLPENGAHLARFLAGSEGTLATILEATVQLVDVPNALLMGVFAYGDMASAADAVVPMLAHKPQAVEGLDARLVERVAGAQGDQS